MLMANRKHDEMRRTIEREQQRVDLQHFMDNASVMEVLGLMAAQYVGQAYRPQFVRAVAACNKVGVSWRVVAKKNKLGGGIGSMMGGASFTIHSPPPENPSPK